MNINRFGATLLAAMVVALPVQANDGGKGGGDAAQRLLQQQQQQEEQQQQQEEQVPEAAAPASAPPTDAASVAARDFYTSVVEGLDAAIQEMQERLAAREKEISKIDHQIAADFAAQRADDKTTNDMTNSADSAMAPALNWKTFDYALKGGPVDPAIKQAIGQINQFKADVEALKSLETARADMAGAARAYGATIN